MIIFVFLVHVVIAIALALHLQYTGLQIVFVIIGAILPDIDHPKSIIGRFNLFSYFMKHRGFAHSLAGCICFALLFERMGQAEYVFIGALSHILADSVSSGFKWVPKLW